MLSIDQGSYAPHVEHVVQSPHQPSMMRAIGTSNISVWSMMYSRKDSVNLF